MKKLTAFFLGFITILSITAAAASKDVSAETSRLYLEDDLKASSSSSVRKYPANGSFNMDGVNYYRGIVSSSINAYAVYNIQDLEAAGLYGMYGRTEGDSGGTLTITGDGKLISGIEHLPGGKPKEINVNIPSGTKELRIAIQSQEPRARFALADAYLAVSPNPPLEEYEISAASVPDGAGTVTGSGRYTSGSGVVLEAAPKIGWFFDGWYEDGVLISQSIKWNFPAAKDRSLEGRFTRSQASLFIINVDTNNTSYGTASANLKRASQGVRISLKAVSKPGYVFDYWETMDFLGGPIPGLIMDAASPSAYFTMPGENVLVIGYFTKDTDPESSLVSTAEITDITQTSATAWGHISENNKHYVEDRGFVYSSRNNRPTLRDNAAYDSTAYSRHAVGAFSVPLEGLAPNTRYYTRAFIKTPSEVYYGGVESFYTGSGEKRQAQINISYITPSGTTAGAQNLTRIIGEALAPGDLTLPSGYALIEPQWRYTVDGDASITVAVSPRGGSSSPSRTNKITMVIGDPYMNVSGVEKEIDPGRGTTPLIVNDRTVVPVRAIVEAMGGQISWDGKERLVTIQNKGRTVFMWIGRQDYSIDGTSGTMDVAPFIRNGRTYLPLRYVAESLDCQIDWIAAERKVVIEY